MLGQSLSRIADAAVTMAVANLSGPLELAGVDEATRDLATDQATGRARDSCRRCSKACFPTTWRSRPAATRSSRPEGALRTVNLAVAFLDLVGFTERSGVLSTEELATAVADFETLAGRVIAAHDARLVKMIGDEVMYVAADATLATEIALELRDAIAGHPVLTGLRGGIVFGEVVAQDGDYYGPEVNLAARIVACAAPGQILGSASVAEALAGHDPIATRAVGARAVRGFADPVPLYVLERRSP